ncbi:MAG: nicotinamide-nucleotide amidohydrolase family protein [Proteobacteria bacterium]|nr:nicotinamide-nucleotide amidohydrolase family protein [Pseudomonadota bacterium]
MSVSNVSPKPVAGRLRPAALAALATRVGEMLKRHSIMLVTAESCTGGWVAQAITAVPGSSAWFERGFITYTNIAKHEMLGVPAATLRAHGAVSEPAVCSMAEGALRHSHAQISLAVSGIAGPGGATKSKPLGTVCFAWAGCGRETRSRTEHFTGDREAVRRQAVVAALQGVLDFLHDAESV